MTTPAYAAARERQFKELAAKRHPRSIEQRLADLEAKVATLEQALQSARQPPAAKPPPRRGRTG